MRGRILSVALVMLSSLTVPGTASQSIHGGVESSDTRVISVTSHGKGAAVEHLTLGLNKAAIVQLDADARDVLVSNPKILDAVVRTSRRVFLLGQGVGVSSASHRANVIEQPGSP